ncbi:DNA gyrase inhibitor YacG [Ruegeria sp. 2012CJ41-6]|uniref:DNA gyrase inhibitor YacG n=1 Tax=Ruegeria spongiae TaxID=2942209 RepID=A0ABT0Q850_9RHOB|nr:DNA gyrase inhibitor YacG [Ruegeria spongiae]MCL6286061.1 DNA gyrase inhibitor YacG [Ruegeria spongiae]
MSCPICGQGADRTYRPFCSKRCADLDLASWFNGSYAVPSSESEASDDLPETPADKLERPH